MIQVNGKWETDDSYNLTTFSGLWTEKSEKPDDLFNKPCRIIEVNESRDKCVILAKNRKKK